MGTRKLRFSPAWVTAVRPRPRPVEYRDTDTKGLILRVEASGRKTWACRYSFEGRERRYRIGAYPEVSLREARDEAERRRGEAALGTDPQHEREKIRLGDTVDEALDVWLDSAEARAWRPRTRPTFESHIKLRLRPMLGALKLAAVERDHVQTLLDSIEGGATRNRCLTVVRLFLRWCVKRGRLEADPTAGIEKLPEEPRERVLADDEIGAVVHAFDATRWGHFVRLLLLLGVRRDELLGARWSDIDRADATWSIPASAEKTGRDRRGGARKVALSTAALAELARQREDNLARGVGASPWIFPTSTGQRPHRDAVKPTLNMLRGRRGNGTVSHHRLAKKREALIPLDVDLHDLRRTCADRLLHRLSVPAYVVDVGVLGHAKPKLLGVYAPTAPLKDTRAALDLWASEVQRILGEKPAAATSERGRA
jgi:integrase